MKSFLLKVLIVIISIVLTYHITIGPKINELYNFISKFKNKDSRIQIAETIRKEIKKNLEKDKIFNDEDKILIRKLIKKIELEFKN
jgi:regulatory protein YycH of two-component signal transduction system YycFG